LWVACMVELHPVVEEHPMLVPHGCAANWANLALGQDYL